MWSHGGGGALNDITSGGRLGEASYDAAWGGMKTSLNKVGKTSTCPIATSGSDSRDRRTVGMRAATRLSAVKRLRLRMRARIVHGQPFGGGGVVRGPGRRRSASPGRDRRPGAACKVEGSAELHSVGGSARRRRLAGLGQRICASAEDRGGQVDDAVTLVEVAAEVAEHRSGLGGGKIAAVLPPGDGGEDFDGGDAAVDPVRRRCAPARSGSRAACSCFIDMAIRQGGRVEGDHPRQSQPGARG